jgi:CRISPR system Cascade subunit CasE
MAEPTELFLSRLLLNARNRLVQANLADCHRLHRTLMSGFPLMPATEPARAELGVLYRPELDPRSGVVTVLVQSRQRPDWSALPGRDDGSHAFLAAPFSLEFDLKPLSSLSGAIAPGQRLRFRLRANPTKRIAVPRAPAPQNKLAGKRVGLLREEDQLAWLERKITAAGAQLLAARTSRDPLAGGSQRGRKEDDRRGTEHAMRFQVVVFDGELLVTDPQLLWASVGAGIGSGKAYGFGLLSLGRG